MCVILIAPNDRPCPEMVEAAYLTNEKGAGAAWREDGRVHWKKGLLSLEEMQELAVNLPLPYVLHFRIPTCGGARKDLAHPFPIDPTLPNTLEGDTDGFVLFHNGHWTRWRESMLETVHNTSCKLPNGKWSDSRAMAWSASIYGLSYLDLLDEKYVAFGPNQEDIEVSTFGWTVVEGIWASNLGWQHKPVWHRRGVKGGGASSTSSSNATNKEAAIDRIVKRGHGSDYHTTAPASMAGAKVDITKMGAKDDTDIPINTYPVLLGGKGDWADGNTTPPPNPNHGFPHANRKGQGGTPPAIPFGQIHPAVALQMCERGDISRKQYKKYRNAWVKAEEKKAKADRKKEKQGFIVH